MRRISQAKTQAQALVEFALSATVIFFLLAAAVDLGLLFFTQQSITNAAQEGATYGSRWLQDKPGTSSVRELNVAEIQRRVRYESGATGGNSVSRLTDLNSDGIDDVGQSGTLDPSGKTGFIQVRAIVDDNRDGNPSNDTKVCTNPASDPLPCFAVVTVRKTYKFFFPFAPAFGNEYTIASTYYLLIRDSYEVASGPPPSTPPPTPPTPVPGAIKIVVVKPTAGTKITAKNQTDFEVKAWDEAQSPGGTQNGKGITKVDMNLYNPTGTLIANASDSAASYCLFGGGCAAMSQPQWNGLLPGTYTFQATATATDGRTASVTITFTK